MQCILSALVAIIIALAPVFNIPLTVVPPKGELPHESEPAPCNRCRGIPLLAEEYYRSKFAQGCSHRRRGRGVRL